MYLLLLLLFFAFGGFVDFVDEHLGEETPYTSKSPFYKVAAAGGKILYIGVTLANAGTSLHVLEDAVEAFKFPVYYPEVFSVKVKLETGEEKTVKTRDYWYQQQYINQI